jgi:hypothetical protein
MPVPGGVPQIRINFDGWSDKYDYTASLDDPDFFPAGYCQLAGQQLQAPKGHAGEFRWGEYLKQINQTMVSSVFV